MKKISLLFLLAAAFVVANAQPKIEFDTKTYDFGKIKEEGGKVTGKFEFTNVGNQPLILTNVRPGCGCTAANYTHDSIAPGAKGYIEATYNPYNRPGVFNKNIRVTTNEPQFEDGAGGTPHMIFIKGEVIKRPPTEFEKAGYAKGNGMVRFQEPNVALTLKNTETSLDTFKVRNFWTNPVSIQLDAKQDYIQEVSRSFGQELKAGEEGIIVLRYDAGKRGIFGQVKDAALFITNDSVEAKKSVHYAVKINEDFSTLSKSQVKNAPIVKYSATSHDFGKLQKNTETSATITLTNEGKLPLIIRRMDSSSGYYKTSMDKMEIAGGATGTLTVTFKASSRTGVQKATIEMITNDPANPVQVIELAAQVQ